MAEPVMLQLFDAVVSRFAADKSNTPVIFGWRGPTQQSDQPARVCWVPGDDQNNDIGQALPAMNPGREDARPIGSLGELYTIYCYSSEEIAIEDERAQYKSARLLFDYFFKHLYHAAYSAGVGGRITLIKGSWLTRKERPHGACIRALWSVRASIDDDAFVYAPQPVTAVIQTVLEHHTGNGDETQSTSDGPVTIPEV